MKNNKTKIDKYSARIMICYGLMILVAVLGLYFMIRFIVAYIEIKNVANTDDFSTLLAAISGMNTYWQLIISAASDASTPIWGLIKYLLIDLSATAILTIFLNVFIKNTQDLCEMDERLKKFEPKIESEISDTQSLKDLLTKIKQEQLDLANKKDKNN